MTINRQQAYTKLVSIDNKLIQTISFYLIKEIIRWERGSMNFMFNISSSREYLIHLQQQKVSC